MKKLRTGIMVLIEARDWAGDAAWQKPEERHQPAPLAEGMGRVDAQDDTTLYLTTWHFLNDPKDVRDSHQIPIGCIEAVYELVVRREPLWRKRKRETHKQGDTVQKSE